MWRDDLQHAAWLRNAMQLVDETKHIRNVLDHVTTYDLFKLVIGKRIWKRTEIVNDVCMTRTIRIDANRAGKFVLTTADVENLFLHALVFVQQQRRQLFKIDGVNRLAQLA